MQLDPALDKFIPRTQCSILDLGCGDGSLLKELYRRGHRLLVGVDKRVRTGTTDYPVIEKDALSFLQINDMPFACIILWDVLEHIPRRDVRDLLVWILANLRPDGTLILHLPNAEGLFGSRILHSDLTHRWAYTPQLITSLLTKAGFVHIECHEARPIIHGPISFLRYCAWVVISAVGRFILAVETGQYNGVLSQNMVVVAKK